MSNNDTYDNGTADDGGGVLEVDEKALKEQVFLMVILGGGFCLATMVLLFCFIWARKRRAEQEDQEMLAISNEFEKREVGGGSGGTISPGGIVSQTTSSHEPTITL